MFSNAHSDAQTIFRGKEDSHSSSNVPRGLVVAPHAVINHPSLEMARAPGLDLAVKCSLMDLKCGIHVALVIVNISKNSQGIAHSEKNQQLCAVRILNVRV